ncbi:Nuclear factor of activated T-cells 5 [Armadillidium nasatum]|uniref:Nuclear factor of activated T-cells 5 n=1 Tax=Armadillidium nasatum TaxID=96803 RepID=A0A5N5SXS9_9CRUS|nr:Nuclear factor of activated T-cells 5 [Armadillidium nasatum]
MDSSNSHSGSPTQRGPPTACAVPGGNSNSGFPGIVLSQFGASNEILVDSGIELCPKRLRLDMTEEANELPEEVASLPQCPDEGGRTKIVSFKNIPGLVLPATAAQVQQTTLLSIPPPRQTIQQAPKPCVVEHLLKQKPSTSVPKTTTKLEKGSTRKKVKGHVLEGNLSSISSDGAYELELLTQPELQHRARYQTEGSRGSVKDREGSGHPCVKVFVASDGAQSNSVIPHLFYQACKVSGKNSTPCSEERIHGTTVLEILMQPEKDMTVSCDCVGILKERNVDVEQRMKSFVTRGKKKSTKCRLVFRTKVTLKSGAQEILQVVSQPISCTQPPGIPEICRKSRSSCSVEGNKELFIIGKNFYKDTEVVFKEVSPQGEIVWSSSVIPEKDFPAVESFDMSSSPVPQLCGDWGSGGSDGCGFLPNIDVAAALGLQEVLLRLLLGHARGRGPFIRARAVKLNEMYTESGGNLPFTTTAALKSNPYSSKEVLFLPQTVTSTSFPTVSTQKQNKNCSSVNGIVKEERISPLPPFPSGPHQVTRVLATVVPQIQMTSSLMPKFTQKALHSNTFTTATVLAPKISPNSTPSHVLGIANSNFAAPMEVKENVLENLIHMLKLLKSIPGNLHNPIVELVADEILRQVRKSNLRSESGAESLPQNVVGQMQNVQPQYVVPNVANEKPSEIQKPNDSVKNLAAFTTNANGLQLTGASSVSCGKSRKSCY